MKKMKYYLCRIVGGECNGEKVICRADNIDDAIAILEDIFETKIVYWCELTEEETENSGLDEY